MEPFRTIDYWLLQGLTALGGSSELRDQIVYGLAEILPYAAVAAGLYLFFSGRTKPQKQRNQEVMLVALAALLLAAGLRFLIGEAILRPRPYVSLPELHHVWLPRTTNVAFPSFHALLLFTFAGVVYYMGKHRRLAVALLVLATIVVLARVAAAVHYPTDVLGGALLGLGLAWLITWQNGWIGRQLK